MHNLNHGSLIFRHVSKISIGSGLTMICRATVTPEYMFIDRGGEEARLEIDPATRQKHVEKYPFPETVAWSEAWIIFWNRFGIYIGCHQSKFQNTVPYLSRNA